jgi:hypothetical protein
MLDARIRVVVLIVLVVAALVVAAVTRLSWSYLLLYGEVMLDTGSA